MYWQHKIECWFKEASNQLTTYKVGENKLSCFYKGFKITYNRSSYQLEDVRLSNMYDEPSEYSLSYLIEYGFIKGADKLQYERDVERVKSIKKTVGKLYDKRKIHRRNLNKGKNKPLNTKRIRNINKHIKNHVDELFLIQNRVEQHEDKYNINK